jgi:hypothetical protein
MKDDFLGEGNDRVMTPDSKLDSVGGSKTKGAGGRIGSVGGCEEEDD